MMRWLGKWLLRLIVLAVLAVVAVGIWKREEIARLLAVNSLFAEDKIVANFSHMDRAFLTAKVSRGAGQTSTLPYGPDTELPPEVSGWVRDRAATSLLVLKQGAVVHEEYYLGTGADDRRMSWSIAKSFLSALFGVLLDQGTIASLDDPVTKYAPELIGSAYTGVSIRNVLNMASGVTFNEDNSDPDSDINRMGRVVALGQGLDDFSAALTERFAEPGEIWKYVSIDTHVLSMVIRGATGRSIMDLMSEKIIAPLGLERDAYYVTDGDGVAFVLGGLNMTTRDYARFGLMIEQDGRYGDTQVVPADWIAAATRASAPTQPGDIGYGFQWWIPKGASAGEFLARGVYGQFIYIDQMRDVVIVITAADRQFRAPGVMDGNVAMFRQIAAALD